MSNLVRKFLGEPLVHFVILAGIIFGVYSNLGPDAETEPQRIEISEGKVAQLAELFNKTWQRPPTPDELKGLIDEFVREEIAYREAQLLGLDKDDTVVRRRMRQKYEFISGSDIGPPPTDADLQSYLEAHAERYATEPMVSYRQIYFDPQRRGEMLEQEIASALKSLRAGEASGAPDVGDKTMLPDSASLAKTSAIARDFGPEFAEALAKVEPGHWTGPIKSGFGLHLVLVSERLPGRAATLEEARSAVARDLTEERRREREARRFEELLNKYEVIVAPVVGGQSEARAGQ